MLADDSGDLLVKDDTNNWADLMEVTDITELVVRNDPAMVLELVGEAVVTDTPI